MILAVLGTEGGPAARAATTAGASALILLIRAVPSGLICPKSAIGRAEVALPSRDEVARAIAFFQATDDGRC
jgi:hypothetical protein